MECHDHSTGGFFAYVSRLCLALSFLAVFPTLPAFGSGLDKLPQMAEVNRNETIQFVVRFDGKKPVLHAVERIKLQITRFNGKASDAVTAPNEKGRDPFKWIFYAELDVKTKEGAHLINGGQCSPWDKDTSVCTVECDGGHFLLKRTPGPDFRYLTVVLRPIPEFLDGDKSAAIRIGGCDGEDEEALLDVKSGKSAQITFQR